MKRFREILLEMKKLAAEPVLMSIIGGIFILLAIFIVWPLFSVAEKGVLPEGKSLFSAYSSVFDSFIYVFESAKEINSVTDVFVFIKDILVAFVLFFKDILIATGYFLQDLVVAARDMFIAFSQMATKSYYYVPFLHSLTVGFWVAIIGTFVGYVFAYALTRIAMPGQKFFRVIATFPIISPPFVVAMAGILLFGRNGGVTNFLFERGIDIYKMGFEIFGFNGLVLFETLSYFPMAFLLLIGVLGAIDNSLEEAAMDLGASRLRVFLTVTLPLSLPGIAASMLLLFIESLADFGTPLIISGNYEVLTAQAYLLVVGALHDLKGASLLAIMLLIPSLIAFLLQKFWLEKRSFVTVTGKPVGGTIKEVSKPVKAGFFAVCSFFMGIIMLFYGMVLFGSFTKQWGADHTLTFINYVELFSQGSDYLRSILTSLYLAGAATPITGLLGMMVAFVVVRRKFPGRGVMEFTAMLTFATPGTFVGIGYILAFNKASHALLFALAVFIIFFMFLLLPKIVLKNPIWSRVIIVGVCVAMYLYTLSPWRVPRLVEGLSLALMAPPVMLLPPYNFGRVPLPLKLCLMGLCMVASCYVLSQGAPPLMLYGTAFLIVMLFVFRNAPVGIRSGVASLQQIDPAIEEASMDLGASSAKTFFKVTLPLISPAFFSGLAYSFVKCMTAISAVIFLSTGNLPLITISILEAIDNSDYSQAAALSVVLMVFVLAVLGLIQILVGMMGARGMKKMA